MLVKPRLHQRVRPFARLEASLAELLNIKYQMKRIFLALILLTLAMALRPTTVYALDSCSDLLTEKIEVENTSVWLESDNLPASALRTTKLVDQLDVEIMLNSFTNRNGVQPVESGVVEILDINGQILFSSDIITGEIASISMGAAVTSAFAKSLEYPEATMVRYRHTHPPGIKDHGAQYRVSEFSLEDSKSSETLRRYKNMIPAFRHLILEVVITYVDPNISEFRLTTEVLKKILKTKSYRLN